MPTDSAPITPPFLRLPPQLRRRIYFRAGLALVDWDRTPLVLDLHGDFGFESSRLGFHGLLLSCRAIYVEASALLYSLNRFVVRMPPAGPYAMYMLQHTGLAALRALTDSSLASLRHLKIVLSEASCHPRKNALRKGQCCDYVDLRWDPCIPRLHPCGEHGPVGHDGPLKDSDATQTVLDEWQSTAAFLSARGVSLANLELSFVCDVQPHQPEIAQLAVAPLGSLAPLKGCHIRLCRQQSTQIQEIANDAVLKARGISAAATKSRTALIKSPGASGLGSRLLALPRELRFRILEYTDLIMPWREVTWNRCSAQYSASRTVCRDVDGMGMTCPPWVHHGCQFSKCWITFPEPSMGCFCGVAHSASSSNCRCWAPPSGLFLICKDFFYDAQAVFFSENRFVVHDFDPMLAWKHPPVPAGGGYPNDRFAISVFLKDIVPTGCLSLLRFVEIVFPPYPHDSWPQDGDDALEDWIDCIHRLKYNANIPALTLRLCMADTSDFRPQKDREELTRENGQKVVKGYMRILEPISELGELGLARFYAHFVWPWTWTEDVQSRVRGGDSQWLLRKEAALKERAERWVMGVRYSALVAGDTEPRECLWRLIFYRDC